MAELRPPPGLLDLPDHLIGLIYLFMPARGCGALAQTCKRFHEIAESEHIWDRFPYCMNGNYDVRIVTRCRMRGASVAGTAAEIIRALQELKGATDSSGPNQRVCVVAVVACKLLAWRRVAFHMY